MQWSKVLLVLSATLVSYAKAQNSTALLQAALTELPECATKCLISSVSKSSCELSDFYCIAHNAPLNAQMEACVHAKCTIREALATKNFTVTAYGLPVRDNTRAVSYAGMIGGGVALLSVILRVIARMPCCGGTWGWDDWGILVAMVPVLPLTALSVVLAEDGLGKDMWAVSFENITKILHVYYFDEMFYLSAIALTKVSILLFYLRIFPNPVFRRLVYVALAYCIGYILGTVIALVFQCSPISLAWDRWDGEHPGKCFNLNLLGWMSAALNIVGDLIVICLPLHELSKLAMSRRKKAGVMLMFLGGGFVTVVSMLRVKYMIQFANSQNVTWDYTPIGYWSTLEVHVGIIIACLPSVRSLQRRIFRSSGTINQYYPSGGYGYNSKGGSPFPSVLSKSKKGGHVDLVTAASQATMLRSRDRSDDKNFIQLEEYELTVGDSKPPTPESNEPFGHAGLSRTQVGRGSLHTDDGAVMLPIQGTKEASYAENRNSRVEIPQVITVRKDYSVTVELTPEQLSASPSRDSEDDYGMRKGRRESQVVLTTLPGMNRRSSSRRRPAGR